MHFNAYNNEAAHILQYNGCADMLLVRDTFYIIMNAPKWLLMRDNHRATDVHAETRASAAALGICSLVRGHSALDTPQRSRRLCKSRIKCSNFACP